MSPGRHRSERLRLLGVVLYMFGLSCRNVVKLLRMLDCKASKSSIERDVAQAGQGAKAYHESAPRLRVRILGVDGTGVAVAGVNAGVLLFVDVQSGRLVCVEPVQEKDSRRVRAHVAAVMAAVRAQELRTDEYSVYEGIVGEDRHRLCLAHWRKSKGKRAYDLYRQALAEDRPLEVESMRRLLELLRLKPRPPTLPVVATLSKFSFSLRTRKLVTSGPTYLSGDRLTAPWRRDGHGCNHFGLVHAQPASVGCREDDLGLLRQGPDEEGVLPGSAQSCGFLRQVS